MSYYHKNDTYSFCYSYTIIMIFLCHIANLHKPRSAIYFAKIQKKMRTDNIFQEKRLSLQKNKVYEIFCHHNKLQ